MKSETKTNDSKARQEYEPMVVRLMNVTPQGVLCASGGGGGASSGLTIKSYSGGSSF